MRACLLIAASVATLCSAAGLAQAQDAVQIGQTVNGALGASDPQGGEADSAYRYHDYAVQGRAGQRIEAVMRSGDFDTYLELRRAGQDEALAEDDDGLGDGTDARLRYTFPTGGAYVLRARSYDDLDGGAYTLALSERPAVRAPRPAGIRIGAAVRGSLAATDPVGDDDIPYDAYALRLREGQRVALSLNAEEFDPVVSIGRNPNGVFDELATNDDSGAGGLNSYLVFQAPSSGEFVIRATAVGDDAAGPYTLAVTDAPPPLAAQTIAIGDTVQGELTTSDGLNDSGEKADAYRFSAQAGDRIVVTLDSGAFDAFVELFSDVGESLKSDDDGGEDTNSRLVYTVPTTGQYVIQARALKTADEEGAEPTARFGAYTLKLERGTPEPEPTALQWGQTVQGEITPADPTDDEGRGFDAYRFTGRAGNRVQIVMRSGDFDTFLQLSKADGDFEAIASDDDGLGEGTDSRLIFALPENGDYVLRASPLGSDAKGLYSLELMDKGPQPEPGSILLGSTARGTLSDSDATADDGAYFDGYRIHLDAGEKVRVTMVSNDFDAYLDIGKEGRDHAWESVVTDDDSLSDTHAKVDWTVEDAGDYIIRARSFAAGQTGAYALTVERKP